MKGAQCPGCDRRNTPNFALFHAEYNPQQDEYVHHRLTQAFEASELIRFAKKSEEVLVCGGDFNCTPTDFAYRMVKFYAGLVDTYTDSPCKTPGSCGETNLTPANSYTNVKTLISNPAGNRIDYIFHQASTTHKVQYFHQASTTHKVQYFHQASTTHKVQYFHQASTTHKVKTKLCDQPWPPRVPQRDFSFSDHEAVRAILTITPVKGCVPTVAWLEAAPTPCVDVVINWAGFPPSSCSQELTRLAQTCSMGLQSHLCWASPGRSCDEDTAESITELQAQTDALLEGAAVCEQGLKKVACNRRLYLTLAGLVMALELAYLALLSLDLSLGALMGLAMLSMVGMLVLAYLLHMGTVFSHLEYSGVQAARLAIRCHLDKLTERNAEVEQERKRSSSFIK
ncbi:putative neutral sphingomyelinase [Chionoecetes opilio]|uniref:Putative neutral sphingomyelinase n=1 Tax=Chionoecetes opilio TaxID=41210 RepID=A0A8J4YC86_CHIOP|nr:putative neutral sphingomyelinase [Chionoecetes opilio]